MARKFYTLNDNWLAEDRRKLLAFARDLLNSDYAGHRLTFVQFAQAPHFNHPSASTTLSTFPGRSNSSRRPRVSPILPTELRVEVPRRVRLDRRTHAGARSADRLTAGAT